MNMHLALNNLQRLICHKAQTTNQPYKKSVSTYVSMFDCVYGSVICSVDPNIELLISKILVASETGA